MNLDIVNIAVVDGTFKGRPAKFLARIIPGPNQSIGFSPIAVILNEDDMADVAGPNGERLVDAETGVPVPQREEVSTGVYL